MSVLIILFLTAVLTLFSGVFHQGKWARYIGIFGLLGALSTSFLPDAHFFLSYQSMFHYDETAMLYTKISITAALLIFLLGGFGFSNHRSHQSELYALMLFSLTGVLIMFCFTNLVTLFIGIEILSIPLYVMAGSHKTDLRSNEASIKYFLMGAFASGFLLFGIALIYGSAGTFDIIKISQFGLTQKSQPLYTMGMVLILSAMAFKVSLAPFHMWSPDVYQGAPSVITAFMASVVKIAGFYAFFKLIHFVFAGTLSEALNILGVLIIITLLLSNVMGLVQSNVKRMLAYSSVSHAGYIALIFFEANSLSLYNMAFYLLAYALSTVGVFMTLIWVEKMKNETSFEAFNGLGKAQPLLATATGISLLSMAGIPLTAGFVAKFSLFTQAMQEPYIGLALVFVAVVGSALSIAYYLKLIIAMFFHKESTFKNTDQASITFQLLAIFIVIALLVLGVYPDFFRALLGQ